MNSPQYLKNKAEAVYDQLSDLMKDVLESEKNLAGNEELLAVVKSIKEELGVDSTISGDPPTTRGCHWCTAQGTKPTLPDAI